MHDLIVIGGGPAGLTAAIYAARACLDVLVVEESFMSGGQLLNNNEVNNYPALPGISGMDLGIKMREHAEKLAIPIVKERVLEVNFENRNKLVMTDGGTYEARCVVLATGCEPKKLGVPGEAELLGHGVSYSAVCDGPYLRNAEAVVIGGGDASAVSALYLAGICKKVYVLYRARRMRAAAILRRRLEDCDNVEMIGSLLTDAIAGENHVGAIWLHDVDTMEKRCIHADAVFVAIGTSPRTEYLNQQVYTNDEGYVVAGEDCRTTVPGVFAVGDIRTKPLRQIITACADGANAIESVKSYLASIAE